MNFRNASKLRNGDEVVVKKTKQVLRVVSIEIPRTMNLVQTKFVLVFCEDGKTYHHTEIS